MRNPPKNILIIEDDPSLLQVLADKFNQEGFQVSVARDGEEGLASLARAIPNIILLDIIMPRMDGITMLKEMRQNPKYIDIPVIVLTNLTDSAAVVNSLEQGAYDYLIKTDWHLADLVNKVKQRLHME